MQLALLDRPAEVGGKVEAFHDRRVHGRLEEGIPALALSFGRVHGGVGIAQHGFGVLAGGDGDADAGGRGEVAVPKHDRRREAFQQRLGRAHGLGPGDILQQHPEFVAAQSGHRVAGPGMTL